MTIIRELYLCLTEVTFTTLGKIMSLYKLGDVAAWALCKLGYLAACHAAT